MCAISYSRPVSNLEKAKYSIGFSCTFVGWLFPRPPCFESPFDVLPSKAISPDTNESRRTFRYRERSDDKLWLLTKMSLLPRRPRKLCLSGCYITPCIQALSTSFKVYINVLGSLLLTNAWSSAHGRLKFFYFCWCLENTLPPNPVRACCSAERSFIAR